MNSIAVAALVYVLGGAISMLVAGMIHLLFAGIQAAQKRAAAKARAEADVALLGAGGGEGEVTL